MTEDEARQRIIASMCPDKVCRVCGEPSRRVVEYERTVIAHQPRSEDARQAAFPGKHGIFASSVGGTGFTIRRETVGFSDCGHDDWRPGKWFDPFQNQEGEVMLTLGNIDE